MRKLALSDDILLQVEKPARYIGNEVNMVVKVGDKVLYSKYAGSEFKVDGKELIIIRQSDILAIVE